MKSIKLKNERSLLLAQNEVQDDIFSGSLAEGVGFEPTDTCISPVFKTGAFGRSATPP
jgi:hypothetical protein